MNPLQIPMETQKQKSKHDIFPILLMGCFFVIIHGLAIIVAGPFEAAGVEAFENPNDPMNLVIFFGILLVMTVLILVIAKYWKKQLIQFLILGAIGYTSFYVFLPLLALLLPDLLALILAILVAVIILIALYKYPEWYIIDFSGVIIGTGAIAIFGISLGILLILILLVVLAVYDAISVYKTKHMIDLADTVMELKLPVLLVVPKIRHYSLIKETKSLKQKIKDEEERDAFFMGLGDVVMPGILVVATYTSIDGGLPISLSVILGTLLGYMILMTFVIKGKPQAGLPSLCGGAILGYLVSSYIFFGELVGINLPF
jgi:presenilin-like A22 family membrane protease